MSFTRSTEKEEFERMEELVKVAKLLAQSAELKMAKLKLREIFTAELLGPCFTLL